MKESIEERIDRLEAGGIIDLHFDLPMDLYEKRDRKNVLETEFLSELDAGNIGAVGVAIYIEDRYLPETALRVALDQIARLYTETAASQRFAICKSYHEIQKAREANRIALLITMEGVEPLGTDLDLLRVFYELGVRSIGLTHARKVEKVRDDLIRVRQFLLDDSKMFPDFGISTVSHGHGEKVNGSRKHGQRVAQFMPDAARELAEYRQLFFSCEFLPQSLRNVPLLTKLVDESAAYVGVDRKPDIQKDQLH